MSKINLKNKLLMKSTEYEDDSYHGDEPETAKI